MITDNSYADERHNGAPSGSLDLIKIVRVTRDFSARFENTAGAGVIIRIAIGQPEFGSGDVEILHVRSAKSAAADMLDRERYGLDQTIIIEAPDGDVALVAPMTDINVVLGIN